MASIDELKSARISKLKLLQEKGIDPYPAKVPHDFDISVLKKDFNKLEASKKDFSVAGRIMVLRGQGAILFAVLFDGTEKIQVIIKKDEISEDVFNLFVDTVDIGDFISVTGKALKSQRGEESVLMKEWKMASKSLLPLPEKWHGLQDVEERYRKRYLDFLMNDELRDLIIKKSKFWDVTREFLKKEGFLEVETPTLEVTTGGAEAEPFKTHHNDFDLPVFMRISVGELWQKRLMAAGFPKTFEIGRIYRNEGSSPEHLQEFTNMEFYWGFADFNDGMELVKKMYRTIAKEVFNKTEFTTKGHTFDLDKDWDVIDYSEEIKKQTGLDISKTNTEEIKEKLNELKVKYDGDNLERLTDSLWKYCRKNIAGPAFLINHPVLVAPLAKANKDGKTVQRFQPILAGSEVGNGYSELNDPVDQRERFELQKKLLDAGDKEAMMTDDEFVEMLEHGMPPACGFGFGERLFAFLADKPLRELQTFPLMRPEGGQKLKKETQIAVVVLNTEANLEKWQVLNTVAHLNAAFGARTGKQLFMQPEITTKDNKKINLNIRHAIMIKESNSRKELQELSKNAKEQGFEVEEFTREMIETTNDKKVTEITKCKLLSEVEFLGVLVFGNKSEVEDLTNEFELSE